MNLEKNKTENYVRTMSKGTLQGKMIYYVSGGLFFIFCILYTLNVLYETVAHFSYFALAANIVRVLTCVAVWMLYLNGKKNKLSAMAFSILGYAMFARLVIHFIRTFPILGLAVTEIDLGTEVLSIDTLGTMGPYIIIVLMVILVLDIIYWCLLGIMFLDARKFSMGQKKHIKVRRYPIFIMGVLVVKHVIEIVFPSIATSGLSGDFLSYGVDSHVILPEIEAIVQKMSSPFGVIAIIITIIEMILLLKMRSLMEGDKK